MRFCLTLLARRSTPLGFEFHFIDNILIVIIAIKVHCSTSDAMIYRIYYMRPFLFCLIINIVTSSINNILVLQLVFNQHKNAVAADPSGGNLVANNDNNKSNSGRAGANEDESERVLKNWRPALLSLFVCISFLTFVVWWYTDAEAKLLAAARAIQDPSLPEAQWAATWLECVLNGGDQNSCSAIAVDYVPLFKMWSTIEMATALVGLWYLLALGSEPEDWKRLLGLFNNAKTTH